MTNARLPIVLLLIVVVLLVISGLHPAERSTWWMETAPIFLAAPFLIVSYRRFPLTPLLYVLVALHAIIRHQCSA